MKTTFGEMAKSIGLVADTTANMNIKTQDLFSSLAVETAHGIDTSEAISGLREALSNVIKPSDDASKEAEKLGIQFNAAHLKSVGWAKFLEEIKDKTHGNTTEMGQLFGSVEGLNSMITLTSESGMQLFNQSLQQMNSNTNYVDEAFEKVNNTSGQNLKKSLNELKNSAINLGESAEPIVEDATNLINSLSNALNGMDKSTIQSIEKITLFTAGLGGVLKVSGSVIEDVGNISKVIGKVSKAIGEAKVATTVASATAEEATAGLATSAGTAATAEEGAAVATTGLATGFGTAVIAAAPWIAAIAAVGLGGYALYKHMNAEAVPAVNLFDNKVEESTKIQGAYGKTMDATVTKTVNFSKTTKDAVGSYISMDNNVKKTMTDMYVNTNQFTGKAKTAAISQYTQMTSKVSYLHTGMKTDLINQFKQIVSQTGTLTTQNKDKIVQLYSQMVNRVDGLTKQQKNAIVKNFQDSLTKSVGITQQQVDGITEQFTEMGTKIKTGMDTHENQEIQTMQTFFSKSLALSDNEEQQVIQKMQQSNSKKKSQIDEYVSKINTIYQAAANNHRSLSQQEQQEVNSIQDKMRNQAVNSLSDSEVESKVILERLKSYGTKITTDQATEIIKNANKTRDGAVQAANDQYDKTVAAIIRQRDESHTVTAAQADQLIKDAGRQRDQSITAAETQRRTIVKKLTSMNSDISKNVNTTTGEVEDNWGKLKKFWENWNPLPKIFKIFTQGQTPSEATKINSSYSGGSGSYSTGGNYSTYGNNAQGTDNWRGGLTWLNEEGEEAIILPGGPQIANLPAGSKVVPHDKLNSLLNQSTAGVNTKAYGQNIVEGMAQGIAGSLSLLQKASGSMADVVTGTIQDKLQMHSPSRVTAILGGYTIDGLAGGINNNLNKVQKAMISAANAMQGDDIKSKIDNLFNGATTDLDSEIDKLDKDSGNLNTNLQNESTSLLDLQDKVTILTAKYHTLGYQLGYNSSEAISSKKDLDDAQNKVTEMGKTIQDTQEKIKKVGYESIYENIEARIKVLSTDTSDLTQKIINQKEELADLNFKQTVLDSEYQNAVSIYGELSEETNTAKKNLDDNAQSILELGNAIQETENKITENMESSLDSLYSKLTESLKSYYQDTEKESEDYWNKQIDANTKWKETTEKNLEDVYNTKIQALSDEETQDDIANSDEDDAEKETELRRELAMHYGAAKKKELTEQLNDLIKTRNRRHQKEEIAAQKETLQEQYNTDKANTEKTAQTNEDSYKEQLESVKTFYADKQKEANIDAEAQKLIVSNNQTEIVNLLKSYGKDYEIAGASLGERLVKGFKDQLYTLADVLNGVSSQSSQIASISTTVKNIGTVVNVPQTVQNTNNSSSSSTTDTIANALKSMKASNGQPFVIKVALDGKEILNSGVKYLDKVQGKTVALTQRRL